MKTFGKLFALLLALILLAGCGEETYDDEPSMPPRAELQQQLDAARASPSPSPTLSPEDWEEIIEQKRSEGLYPIYSTTEPDKVVGWTTTLPANFRPTPDIPPEDMVQINGSAVAPNAKTVTLVNPTGQDLEALTQLPMLQFLCIDIESPEAAEIVLPELSSLEIVELYLLCEGVELDLSACRSLYTVQLDDCGDRYFLPAALKLPDSVRTMYCRSDFDFDLLAALPNLRNLFIAGEAIDLGVLKKLGTLESLSLCTAGWDLSPLKNMRLGWLDVNVPQPGAQEMLDSFAGADGLKTIAISDYYVSDLSRMMSHLDGITRVSIAIDPRANGREWTDDDGWHYERWYDEELGEDNIDRLDELVTNIPLEQIRTLYASGVTVYFAHDPNRQEVS